MTTHRPAARRLLRRRSPPGRSRPGALPRRSGGAGHVVVVGGEPGRTHHPGANVRRDGIRAAQDRLRGAGIRVVHLRVSARPGLAGSGTDPGSARLSNGIGTAGRITTGDCVRSSTSSIEPRDRGASPDRAGRAEEPRQIGVRRTRSPPDSWARGCDCRAAVNGARSDRPSRPTTSPGPSTRHRRRIHRDAGLRRLTLTVRRDRDRASSQAGGCRPDPPRSPRSRAATTRRTAMAMSYATSHARATCSEPPSAASEPARPEISCSATPGCGAAAETPAAAAASPGRRSRHSRRRASWSPREGPPEAMTVTPGS